MGGIVKFVSSSGGLLKITLMQMYRHLGDLGWAPPSHMPNLPVFYLPEQNWADGGITKTKSTLQSYRAIQHLDSYILLTSN